MPENGKKKQKQKRKAKGSKREKPPGTSVVDENTKPNDIVEALLREFMYRKGLGHILEAFDVSRPRGDQTINSVKAIYTALGLTDIYKSMRETDKNVSVFEVLVAHTFKKPGESAPETSASQAAGKDASQFEEKVNSLEAQLEESKSDNNRLEKSILNLKKIIVDQKKELDIARDTATKQETASMEDVANRSKSPSSEKSRFGLSSLPGLSGQKKDPLTDGAVIVGGGVLKTEKKKANSSPRKSVKFQDTDQWLKCDNVIEATTAAKAAPQPVKSVVYYRQQDPTTLLSPVPFHGTYYQKLESGELDKGSEEVEEAIAQGKNGLDVIKLDSSEVSKYYIGRIVDSINESGIAVVVEIVSDNGTGNGRGAIFITPLSVSGRHRCRPPPPNFNPPTAATTAPQQSKLCTYNCGFFGSAEYGGACSKCYDEAQKKLANDAVKTNLFASNDSNSADSTQGAATTADDGDDSYSDDDFDDPDYDFSDF